MFKGSQAKLIRWKQHSYSLHKMDQNGPKTADTLPQGHVTAAAQEMLAVGISKLSAGSLGYFRRGKMCCEWQPAFQKYPSHGEVLSFHSKHCKDHDASQAEGPYLLSAKFKSVSQWLQIRLGLHRLVHSKVAISMQRKIAHLARQFHILVWCQGHVERQFSD